jgi:hypothetical protein
VTALLLREAVLRPHAVERLLGVRLAVDLQREAYSIVTQARDRGRVEAVLPRVQGEAVFPGAILLLVGA